VINEAVGIEEFLQGILSGCRVIDVRTPAEFASGHIPGAVNLPLFSNEERAVVGTTYKQVGRNKAILDGLKFVGPHLHELAKEGMALAETGAAQKKPLLVHCWRGGMRSSSMAWLLNMMEVQTRTLRRGYKGFRNHVLQTFTLPFHFIVLGGKTGSAKTQVLKALQNHGQQVVDLEGLAHHRGSAFGAIGQKSTVTQEQFENELAVQLRAFDAEKPIWIEDESRHVGRSVIPLGVWEKMRSANVLYLDIPQQVRAQYLLSQYGFQDEVDFLGQAFVDIRKRLGDVNYHEAMAALGDQDLAKAGKIALDYYDRAYEYGLGKRDPATICRINIDSIDMESMAKILLRHAGVDPKE